MNFSYAWHEIMDGPHARPPPEEKDGATPLKRPSKSLDDDEGEKKDP